MRQTLSQFPISKLTLYFRDAAIKNHKFGLIYQPVGDTTEKELFRHYQHSERMEKFLLMLGTKVDLSQHSGYFGGLHNFVKEIEENEEQDRVKGGSHSLYTEHDNKGVMFHVSTLLPTTIDGTDDQQIPVNFTFLFSKEYFLLIYYTITNIMRLK